jgi:hypothetical protein
MDWKALMLVGVLTSSPGICATDDSQKLLLMQVLRADQEDWPAVLVDHREQLDEAFFERVRVRILWAVENNQIEDAIRFSVVGDMASQTLGRPGSYRATLVEAFERSGNLDAARRARQSLP